MAESTLSINRDDIRTALQVHLGWVAPASWSASQETQFGVILGKGLRQFYNPPVLPGELLSHRWSFMRPNYTFTTVNDVYQYDLPEDFGGIDGDLTYGTEDSGLGPVTRLSELAIRALRQNMSDLTGYPDRFAVIPLPTDGTTPQRFAIQFYPTPNGAYELTFRYHSNPLLITSSKPYPLGGQPHAETLMASILAAAELVLDDAKGERWADFIERLQASVSHDRQEMLPRDLGYVGDRSHCVFPPSRATAITFEGITYGD